MTATTQRPACRSEQGPKLPRTSEVYYIGRAASVQFALRPFNFRVSHVRDVDPYSPWLWLDGYELNLSGDAVVQRSIFVLRTGLRPPVVIPQQRRPRPQTGTVDGQ